MKRAASEEDARKARDLAIECMALLGRSVRAAKACCTEEFFLRYRKACAFLMGEIGDVINRAAFDFPVLKPTEEGWNVVADARAGDVLTQDAALVDAEQIRQVLALVRSRIAEVQVVAPAMVDGPAMARTLEEVERLADGWERRSA